LRADATWAPPPGGGNVSNSGTPTSGQLAQWTSATQIKGVNVSQVIQKFTASGTYTPSPGMISCVIECIGGGGGGGGTAVVATSWMSAAGGGAGGYSRALKTAAQIGASQPVTIGAAGNGGATGANSGSAGGDTFVGATLGTALCAAKGGSGGQGWFINVSALGGAGGVIAGAVGDVVFAGAPGLAGFQNNGPATYAIFMFGGAGGSSAFGGGANAAMTVPSASAVNGNNASNYGSGGSGGMSNQSSFTTAGGNGSAGIVIITELCVT
jgi:hypothetical protein